MYQRRQQALRGHSYRRLRLERGMECLSMYLLNACSVSLTGDSQIINTGDNARKRNRPVRERRQDDGFHRRTRGIVRATTTGEPSLGRIKGLSLTIPIHVDGTSHILARRSNSQPRSRRRRGFRSSGSGRESGWTGNRGRPSKATRG